MTRTALALMLALALIAGCGGDDDGDGGDGGGTPASREDFVAEANEICRDASQRAQEIVQERQGEIQQAGSPEEQQKIAADILDQTVDEYDPYLDRLRELDPPEELTDDWSRFMDGIDRAFDLIPELADATREGDREKLTELTGDFRAIADDTRPFAQQHRLDDCLPDGGEAQ